MNIKSIILLLIALPSAAQSINYSPQAYRSLQAGGLVADGLRMATDFAGIGSENEIARLQKNIGRIKRIMQLRPDKAAGQGRRLAKYQVALKRKLKEVQRNHKVAMGVAALSDGVSVRNNWAEKGIGALGSLLATTEVPEERLGKQLWLKGLLSAADGGLSIARHVYYQNPKQMAFMTAAQRTARLLRLLLTYGVKKVDKRVVAAYITHLLGIGASFVGDPRENTLKNFDWQGRLIPSNTPLAQLENTLKAEQRDPSLSLDRRKAIGVTGERLAQAFSEDQKRTNINNMLTVSDSLQSKVRQTIEPDEGPDREGFENDLRMAMLGKADNSRFLIEQVVPRGSLEWREKHEAAAEQVEIKIATLMSQLPGSQSHFTVEDILAARNAAIDEHVLRDEAKEQLLASITPSSAQVRMKTMQLKGQRLTQKKEAESQRLYGKSVGDLEEDDEIKKINKVRLAPEEEAQVTHDALVAVRRDNPIGRAQIGEKVASLRQSAERANKDNTLSEAHAMKIAALGLRGDYAKAVRNTGWDAMQGERFTVDQIRRLYEGEIDRMVVAQLVENHVNHPRLRKVAKDKLVSKRIDALLYDGHRELTADLRAARHNVEARNRVDRLSRVAVSGLSARGKERMKEPCLACRNKAGDGVPQVELCQQCNAVVCAPCFSQQGFVSCPNCRNDDLRSRRIGRSSISDWLDRVVTFSASKQPVIDPNHGNQGLVRSDEEFMEQALWKVAQYLCSEQELALIVSEPPENRQWSLINKVETKLNEGGGIPAF